jgi:hypothetical protein
VLLINTQKAAADITIVALVYLYSGGAPAFKTQMVANKERSKI